MSREDECRAEACPAPWGVTRPRFTRRGTGSRPGTSPAGNARPTHLRPAGSLIAPSGTDYRGSQNNLTALAADSRFSRSGRRGERSPARESRDGSCVTRFCQTQQSGFPACGTSPPNTDPGTVLQVGKTTATRELTAAPALSHRSGLISSTHSLSFPSLLSCPDFGRSA